MTKRQTTRKDKILVILTLGIMNSAIFVCSYGIYLVYINTNLILSISRWLGILITSVYILYGILILGILMIDSFAIRKGYTGIIKRMEK